jgi:hypothetical protein
LIEQKKLSHGYDLEMENLLSLLAMQNLNAIIDEVGFPTAEKLN